MNGIKDIHIGVIPVKSGELLLECLETGGGGIRVEFVRQLFGGAETAGSFISVEMNEGAEDRENVELDVDRLLDALAGFGNRFRHRWCFLSKMVESVCLEGYLSPGTGPQNPQPRA